MKVVAINGSPKENGNTNYAIKTVLNVLETENIKTEIIHIGNKKIQGCMGCNSCAKAQNEKCIINDEVNDVLQILKTADGIILGTPVHFAGVGGTMKSFLDRTFYVAGVNGGLFRHKVGAGVVAVRRSGGMTTFTELNNYLLYCEMFLPTSNYWNIIHGLRPEEASQDNEGNQIMRILGNNMAYLLKMQEYSKDNILPPLQEKKIFTHFIR